MTMSGGPLPLVVYAIRAPTRDSANRTPDTIPRSLVATRPPEAEIARGRLKCRLCTPVTGAEQAEKVLDRSARPMHELLGERSWTHQDERARSRRSGRQRHGRWSRIGRT